MYLLAHLSDPHIGPLPRPRLAELASKRVLGYVNWRRRRAAAHPLATLEALTADLAGQPHDHIAVTGDLVNIALPDEFVVARAWLERLGSPRDVTLVPGNHDAYLRTGLSHWDTQWKPFMEGDVSATSEPASRFPFVRRRGPVALIGLSSAIPTPPFSAAGRLGRAQIVRLTTLLRTLADEELFRVVLIHHPPLHAATSRHKRLIDAAPFRVALAQAGAELVLHGHDHRHALVWLDGPGCRIPAIGIPSASASASSKPSDQNDPAAYNLYAIGGGPGRWSCEMVSRGFRRGEAQIVQLDRQTIY